MTSIDYETVGSLALERIGEGTLRRGVECADRTLAAWPDLYGNIRWTEVTNAPGLAAPVWIVTTIEWSLIRDAVLRKPAGERAYMEFGRARLHVSTLDTRAEFVQLQDGTWELTSCERKNL